MCWYSEKIFSLIAQILHILDKFIDSPTTRYLKNLMNRNGDNKTHQWFSVAYKFNPQDTQSLTQTLNYCLYECCFQFNDI